MEFISIFHLATFVTRCLRAIIRRVHYLGRQLQRSHRQPQCEQWELPPLTIIRRPTKMIPNVKMGPSKVVTRLPKLFAIRSPGKRQITAKKPRSHLRIAGTRRRKIDARRARMMSAVNCGSKARVESGTVSMPLYEAGSASAFRVRRQKMWYDNPEMHQSDDLFFLDAHRFSRALRNHASVHRKH